MSVTVAAFKARFREFTFADADMCAAALAGVEATVSVDAFPSEASRDEVVMLSLAHSLALSPSGRDAQMVFKGEHGESVTSYGARLAELRSGNACLHPFRWGTTS